MRWHEITVHTTEEAIEMISNFFHELGAGGVSIEESGTLNKQRDTSLGQWYELPLNDIPEGEAVIKGYFSDPVDVDGTMRQLHASIQQLREFDIDTGHAAIHSKEVSEEDWANAWKQYFKPLRISNHITIKPTWEAYEPQAGELIIELDPGMAFGTGTHPTTALCLRTLEKVVSGGENVIDVGTGSGVLAIAAVKLGANHVLALDLDPVAVSSALENTGINGLEEKITVRQSDLLQVLRLDEGSKVRLGITIPVQVIVANILAEIILLLLNDVYEVLEQGGYFIASGIITSKEANIDKALLAARFTITDRFYENDWVVLVARKL